MRRIILLALGIVGFGLLLNNVIFKLSQPKIVINDELGDEDVKTKAQPKHAKKSSRAPASKTTELFKPEVRKIDREDVKDLLGNSEAQSNNEQTTNSAIIPQDVAAESVPRERRRSSTATPSSSVAAPTPAATGSTPPAVATNGDLLPNFIGDTVSPTDGSVPATNTPSQSGGVGGTNDTPVDTALTCSSSLGGGAYSYPLQITISCTATADIKYCLGAGGVCCDPETTGTDYTAGVVVGAVDGNYCLSFYGQSDALNKTSTIVQNSYTVNHTLPHLDSIFVRRYFQTTQLYGINYLQSNNFSLPGHLGGQVNLRGTEPTPMGLNLSCNDIMNDSVLAGVPDHTFATVMAALNLTTLTTSTVLEIPMRPDHLIYGENNLVTYVTDNRGAFPLHSCSTNKVYLEDFDYFTADIAFGSVGTDQVREFSGGFTPYGYIDVDNSSLPLGRAPASLVNQDQTGQELRIGLFGVFY